MHDEIFCYLSKLLTQAGAEEAGPLPLLLLVLLLLVLCSLVLGDVLEGAGGRDDLRAGCALRRATAGELVLLISFPSM